MKTGFVFSELNMLCTCPPGI